MFSADIGVENHQIASDGGVFANVKAENLKFLQVQTEVIIHSSIMQKIFRQTVDCEVFV